MCADSATHKLDIVLVRQIHTDVRFFVDNVHFIRQRQTMQNHLQRQKPGLIPCRRKHSFITFRFITGALTRTRNKISSIGVGSKMTSTTAITPIHYSPKGGKIKRYYHGKN